MDNATLEYARAYFNTVRERYEEYRAAAREDQIAVMRYYTPAGEEIRVAHVTLDQRYGMLLIRGDDGVSGQIGDPCDVITSPQSAQVVIRLISRVGESAELERSPIGFTPSQ